MKLLAVALLTRLFPRSQRTKTAFISTSPVMAVALPLLIIGLSLSLSLASRFSSSGRILDFSSAQIIATSPALLLELHYMSDGWINSTLRIAPWSRPLSILLPTDSTLGTLSSLQDLSMPATESLTTRCLLYSLILMRRSLHSTWVWSTRTSVPSVCTRLVKCVMVVASQWLVWKIEDWQAVMVSSKAFTCYYVSYHYMVSPFDTLV